MRKVHRLTPAKVRQISEPGMYADGAGLYLHVGDAFDPKNDPFVGKSWILRYMLDRRSREMGLGPLYTIGLADARTRAAGARKLLLDGLDPLDVRHAERKARQAEHAKAVTFKECAEKYIKADRPAWRNAKHAAQWESTLATYAYPVIGKLPVGDVETAHITKILEPIWATKPETASRVRGRIEAVLDYAATKRWRQGENCARWRGHLQHVLPKKAKVARVQHHAALPWPETGKFMAEIEKQEGVAALALHFTILTAARTGEVIGARWAEIDMNAKLWTIPADRIKAGREHRIPLSAEALAVLRKAEKLGGDVYVFPGAKAAKPLSNMAMAVLLRRMKRDDLTVHGFRSTFSDWAAETGRPTDIREAALAHVLASKTEAAYQRGDLLDRRRRLMADWARFATSTEPTGEVVPMQRRRRPVA